MPAPGNVAWALSDQERLLLVAKEVRECQHTYGPWRRDEGLIVRFLPRVVYLHRGRFVRVCKCGWREYRQGEW